MPIVGSAFDGESKKVLEICTHMYRILTEQDTLHQGTSEILQKLLSEFLGEWATQTFIKYIFFAGNSSELQGYIKVDLKNF